MSVLSVSTRSVVVSPCGLTRPVSSANGTTAASMLPQLGVVSTVSLSGCSCANRKSRSTPGREPFETMPTLLVSGCAPPSPSIWRLSGEPITASSTLSRVGISAGRSAALKNGPREVPPRMNRQGMAVCMALTRALDVSHSGGSGSALPPSAISNSYHVPAWVKAPGHAGNALSRQPAHQFGQKPHRVQRQRRRPLVRRDREAQHADRRRVGQPAHHEFAGSS